MGEHCTVSKQQLDIIVERHSLGVARACQTHPGAPAGHSLTSDLPQVSSDSPSAPATPELLETAQPGNSNSSADFYSGVPGVSKAPVPANTSSSKHQTAALQAKEFSTAKNSFFSLPGGSRPPVPQPNEVPVMNSSSYPAPVGTYSYEAGSSSQAAASTSAAVDAAPELPVGAYRKAAAYAAEHEAAGAGAQDVDLEAGLNGEKKSPMALRLLKPSSIFPSVCFSNRHVKPSSSVLADTTELGLALTVSGVTSSFLIQVVLLGLVIAELVLVFLNYDRQSGKVTPKIPMYIIAIVFGVIYLAWYTPEWCRSTTHKALGNQQQENTLFEYVEVLRKTKPTLTMHAKCWHTETRTRTVTDGKGNTRTETYTVTVVTHQSMLSSSTLDADESRLCLLIGRKCHAWALVLAQASITTSA